MRYLNRAAGGAAILLLLAVLVVSCQSLLFGTLAQADECVSEPEYDRVAGALLQHARQQVRREPLVRDPDLDTEMLSKACAVAAESGDGLTDYQTFLNSVISSERFWTAISHPGVCRYGTAHVMRDDGRVVVFLHFTDRKCGGVAL